MNEKWFLQNESTTCSLNVYSHLMKLDYAQFLEDKLKAEIFKPLQL